MADQFAPNHKLCYRCQGSGRERGVFYGKDPGDCKDCGGKGVVFKGTPPSPSGVVRVCSAHDAACAEVPVGLRCAGCPDGVAVAHAVEQVKCTACDWIGPVTAAAGFAQCDCPRCLAPVTGVALPQTDQPKET